MVEESLFSSYCLSRKNATLECLFQRSTHLQSQILEDASSNYAGFRVVVRVQPC